MKSDDARFSRLCRIAAVFVLVLLTLAAIPLLLMPVFARHGLPARRLRCASNLKQIGFACHLYAGDHDGLHPPDLASTFPEYVSDARVYACPTVQRRGRVTAQEVPRDEPLPDCQVCYCYVSGLKADDDSGYILAFDEEWNHRNERGHRRDGLNVLHVAGDVRWECDFKAFHKHLAKQAEELAAQGRTMHIIRPSWSRWPEGPEYPVTPLRKRPVLIALAGVGAATLVAGVALVIIRLRRRQPRRRREGPGGTA